MNRTDPRLLVYSRTAGYRHDSIPAGIRALRLLGEQAGCAVDATEDPAAFTTGGLARYTAVVFLSTSGDVLDDAGRDALRGYMAAGGAWLGIHGAATTEYDWPYYGGLAGARFSGHPPEQTATVTVEDRGHPATSHLPAAWAWHDEWATTSAPIRGLTSACCSPSTRPATTAEQWARTIPSRGVMSTAEAAAATPRSVMPRGRSPSRRSSVISAAHCSG